MPEHGLTRVCGVLHTDTGVMMMEKQVEMVYTPPKGRQWISPGDVVWTWCSKHMERTDHLWDGFKLICVACRDEIAACSKSTTQDRNDN